MRLDEVKRPKKRFYVADISGLEIQAYGEGNNYPQNISEIINTSTNAKNCLQQYAKFIRGNGFKDLIFYKSVVNYKGQTCDTLLRLCSNDLAKFGGFALHVNYNLLFEIVSVEHVPFENCRLGLEDDNGYIGKIAINSNWIGRRNKKPTIENTDYIDVFNPDPDIIRYQMEHQGGIDKYLGQVLYISSGGELSYPLPIYDSAITDISTDEGLANIRYRCVRNNFFPLGMFIYRMRQKGLYEDNTIDGKSEGEEYQVSFDPNSFIEFQGDMNACNIMGLGIENDEDKPEFVQFPTNTMDKDFEVTKNAVASEIYSAFNQDVFYRIRTGALGFSNEIISDAFQFYNAMTSDERILLEQSFASVFRLFTGSINQSGDFSINPLTYAVQTI